MIASSPVGGRRLWDWLLKLGAYATAMLAGALMTGFCLYLLGRTILLPPQFVGIVALATAVVAVHPISARLSLSRWRVPKSWGRFGHTVYSGLFGGALGLGFVTAMPSVGFLALVAWALVEIRPQNIGFVFAAFGVARGIPLLIIAASGRGDTAHSIRLLKRFSSFAENGHLGEIVLLTMAGVLFL